MKNLLLVAVTCLAIVVLALAVNTSGVSACGGWICGDSVTLPGAGQLCVNGQVLTVDPSATAQVYIHVPGNAAVDTNVADCGGTLPTMGASGVSPDSPGHLLKVGVVTAPGATVDFSYGDNHVTLSNATGAVNASFQTQ